MKNKPLTSVPEAARCYNGLAYLLAFVCVLFLAIPMAVWGQAKEYATWTPNSGVIPRGVLGAGGAGVTNPTHAANSLETEWALLRAEQVALLAPVSGGGAYLQLKFDAPVAPGTTTFVKISDITRSEERRVGKAGGRRRA